MCDKLDIVSYVVFTSLVLLSEDGVRTVNSTDFTLIEEETHGERLNDGTYVIEGKLRQEIEGGYTGLMIAFELLDRYHHLISHHGFLLQLK